MLLNILPSDTNCIARILPYLQALPYKTARFLVSPIRGATLWLMSTDSESHTRSVFSSIFAKEDTRWLR